MTYRDRVVKKMRRKVKWLRHNRSKDITQSYLKALAELVSLPVTASRTQVSSVLVSNGINPEQIGDADDRTNRRAAVCTSPEAFTSTSDLSARGAEEA